MRLLKKYAIGGKMNKWWIDAWEKSYKTVFWHETLPYCIDDDGKKRYAGWQVTDCIEPDDNWKPFDVEIPHLVRPLKNGTTIRKNDKHHFRMHSNTFPKTKYLRQIERKIEKHNLTYRDDGFDDILFHKCLKYDMRLCVLSFLKEIKDKTIIRSLYVDGEFYSGNIGIQTDKGIGHWIPSYNNKFSGSGQVLIYYLMKEFKTVDFMLGNENYKMIWNPVIEPLYTGHL